MIVYTDRSRIETDQRCPRLRAYTYEWEGRGLALDNDNTVGRDIGSCVHAGIDAALTGADLDGALTAAHASPQYRRLTSEDDRDTVDALVRTWWAVVRPQLAQDWTVETVEREEIAETEAEGETVR